MKVSKLYVSCLYTILHKIRSVVLQIFARTTTTTTSTTYTVLHPFLFQVPSALSHSLRWRGHGLLCHLNEEWLLKSLVLPLGEPALARWFDQQKHVWYVPIIPFFCYPPSYLPHPWLNLFRMVCTLKQVLANNPGRTWFQTLQRCHRR